MSVELATLVICLWFGVSIYETWVLINLRNRIEDLERQIKPHGGRDE